MKYLLSFFPTIIALVFPKVSFAQTLLPSCATGAGDCDTCEMLTLFTNLAELITVWISGVALITFVFGGLMWLTSGGNAERVERGKQVLIGTVIGVGLVLGGYTIVNFSVAAFLGQERAENVQLFGTQWAQFCTQTRQDAPAEDQTESSVGDQTPEGQSEQPQGTIVDDCTGVPNGAECSIAFCEDNCECLDEICQPACTVHYDGVCTATDIECTVDRLGEVEDVPGICPSLNPHCCIVE